MAKHWAKAWKSQPAPRSPGVEGDVWVAQSRAVRIPGSRLTPLKGLLSLLVSRLFAPFATFIDGTVKSGLVRFTVVL